MSQTLEEPLVHARTLEESAATEPVDAEHSDEQPNRWQRLFLWDWRHLGAVLAFCLFFLFCNYLRLFYSDIWGHIAYGNWILDHQVLPTDEPFVSLAEGMRVVDTAWLGQVVLAQAGRWGGVEAYSTVFAISMTLTYLILARVIYLQTSSVGLSVLGSFLAWGVNWGRHAVIRPEMFGGVCFALVLWLVVRSDSRRRRMTSEPTPENTRWTRWDQLVFWLGVPVVFAAWANLHGSFVVGFAVLGCYALGRAIEVLWREQSLMSVLRDREFHRWLWATELAVLATLVNPYGMDLLINTALFPSNPNLKDIMEWYSLEMISLEGITVGASWILLLVLFRHSRARIAAADVLLLAVFTLAVCMRTRMVAWYAPVWILVLAPHGKDVRDRLAAAFSRQAEKYRGWACAGSTRRAMFGGLAIWLAFVFSPTSRFVLGGPERSADQLYHSQTPLGVTKYFREHPPEGLVANPQWWGDWLVWDGPKDLQVMMTTNAVHVVPPRVWQDYLKISRGDVRLESLLEKYRINTIIVHKELQQDLHRALRGHLGWKTVYEDDLALVAVRKRSLDKSE